MSMTMTMEEADIFIKHMANEVGACNNHMPMQDWNELCVEKC